MLVIACLANASLAEQHAACALDVPVYDQFGNKMQFKVTGVTIDEGGKKVNLLGRTVDGITITSHDDQIFFSSDRIVGARPIEVALEDAQGHRIESKMIVTACRLRRSLFFGQSDLGIDVTSVPVKGRLVGCRFVGDWWVRAMPMFGGHFGAPVEDGYVNPDGSFLLEVGATGVRHLLVVGKGKQPIKVVGVDITVGKKADAGIVELSGACPH